VLFGLGCVLSDISDDGRTASDGSRLRNISGFCLHTVKNKGILEVFKMVSYLG